MIWAEKYSPKSLASFCGNHTAVAKVKTWALDFERGNRGRPLLVWGSPGVGKTALCNALCQEMNWEPVFMTSSDLRNKDQIARVAGIASTSGSLSGGKKFIIIEDIDAMAGEDRGGVGAIAEILRNATNPVIATAENYWNQKISSLRTLYENIPLRKVGSASIVPLLERILKLEEIGYSPEALSGIAEISNGDIRSAINDLQAVAEGKKEITVDDLSLLQKRDREQDIWEGIGALLKSKTYSEALEIARGIDAEPDFLAKFVEENIPVEYTDPEDIARAFNSLSRADIFNGRIMIRQHWGFLRYATVLATAGVALAKEREYHGWKKYSFPSGIGRLGRTKGERAQMKVIGKKIGIKCHTSIKEAKMFVPLIKVLLLQQPRETMEYFGFEIEEMATLLGKSETQAEKLLLGEGKEKPKKETKAKTLRTKKVIGEGTKEAVAKEEPKLDETKKETKDEKPKKKPKVEEKLAESLTGF